MAPIPITIITGFLGSGKTTLILNLLPQLRRKNPAYKLALLKNEFGDLAVDSQLAASSAIAGVQEMLNGCICCNLVGQLGPALDELARTVRPDRVVIETSGSAFPATLALEVNRLARESGRYSLDGVVSVIDVENWQGYEDTSYTARIQARYTDLIVFNKWEAAGEDRYERCLDRVGDLEVDVAKVKSAKGYVDAGLVFGVDGALARELTEDGGGGGGGGVANGTLPHTHHQSEVEVLSVELRADAPAAVVATDKLLALLRAAPKDEAYRIKAVATLSSPPADSDADAPPPAGHPAGRYILNWAFGRWTFTPVPQPRQEHESSRDATLRMTVILGRCESAKWKKKLEAGGYIALQGPDRGELSMNDDMTTRQRQAIPQICVDSTIEQYTQAQCPTGRETFFSPPTKAIPYIPRLSIAAAVAHQRNPLPRVLRISKTPFKNSDSHRTARWPCPPAHSVCTPSRV
ncbi:uncharacterized protein UV8b_06902 [Ustilaginoidea virens]|uniref:CobW/HypB/UreG nucleotide-binding domain-containing protein n=1 Tax=Ustilaginoidea virens TaxID=1159556 RepID=A0A8E5HW54_USTVR|nr:uncharacterized protein UV8b_06902 [Ustilaginoidea virens]QUC22661.1 hypothetical protein UV8b_06902 [Ustilaginoidea virens]